MEILDHTLVSVVFKLTNFKCPKNVVPAITGDIYELGEWQLKRAIIASPLIYEVTDSEDGVEEDEKENDVNVKVNGVKENYVNVKRNGGNVKENGVKENNMNVKENYVKEGYNEACGCKENDERGNGEFEETDQVWFCEVKVPIATEFEWNWALVSRDETRTTFYKVERTVRRKDSVGYFKKIIPSLWEKESFHPNHIAVEACDVKISLQEKTVYKHHRVCISGSVPALGCWVPTRSIIATRLNESPDQWGVQFKLPRKSRPVYWKWAVINIKTQKIVSWESRVNRILHVRTDNLALRSIWNENGEARVISGSNYPKIEKKSKNENKVKLTKPVRDHDLAHPPALYYEMLREIYSIYSALRPDGSYQYRRYKNLASVEGFPKLKTFVDITSNILQYREAIVFQVTDVGGKRNGFRFAFRGSEFDALNYPDPEVLTEMSFSYLMRYCSDGPYYHLGPHIVPYENETTKTDKMTSWVKRSFYNKEKNIKIEFVLKPEADYLCIRPADISPQICPKHPPNRKPNADGDNWRESIPQNVHEEKGAPKRSSDQAVPPTKVTKGTQTRWTNRPSINQAKAASEYKHKQGPVKESTKVLTKAKKQTDTEEKHTGVYQTCTDAVTDEGLHQTYTKEIVNQCLYQTDVDTGKGERFHEKNITHTREGLIHMNTNVRKNEDSNRNDKDKGKHEGYSSKFKPLFNIAVLALRSVFL